MTTNASLRASARRFGAAGAALLLSLLSCGREITGPGGGLRFAEGLSFVAQFPGELANVEQGAGSVVPYTSVRVVFTRVNGAVALARVLPVSSAVAEFEATLSVPLSADAPASGEELTLNLQYINAAGDTVFRGGPAQVVARQLRRGEPAPQPTPIVVTYSGPGASATAIEVVPDTIRLEAGAPFTFSAAVRDAQGAPVTDAPLLFSALDTQRATLTGIGAGAGLTLATRGIARVRVALAAGTAADTGILVIAPKPSTLTRVGTGSIVGLVGTTLADSIVVRILATDGLPIEGVAIGVAITGGGTTTDSSLVTDATGRAALQWTLGAAVGTAAQGLRFTSVGVPDLSLSADVTGQVLPATRLLITQQPTSAISSVVFGSSVIVQARDSTGAVAVNYSGNVLLNVIETPLGGSILGPNSLSAIGGVATFPSLTPTKAGTYRFTASASGLIPDTSDAIVVSAGAPTAIVAQGGGGQSGQVGTALTQPIVVRIADAADNPVPNAVVTFAIATGGGSLTGAVDTTDASGLATLGSWTLGAAAGAQTITATVSGVAPLTISATAIALAPVINLGIVGSNVIGFQRTGQLSVRLGQPAPIGGLVVSVQSDSTQFLTVAVPGTVTIDAGDTLATIDATGIAVGVARVRASATGWEADTVNVPVSLNLISLPLLLNVPLDGAVSLPVQLSTPAPSGGVGVTLTVAGTSIVSTSPNPVLVAAGTSTQNASVQGLQIGSTTITATHPNYAPATTTVNVTAAIDIQQATLTLNESFSTTMTVRLLSGGLAVPAPAGGVAVALEAANPLCAAVPAATTIGAGLTSVSVTVARGTGTTFPCATIVRAAGPLGFASDSATANVGATPTVTTAAATIGAGLQRAASVALGYAQHGGTAVRVASSDTTKLLVSLSSTTAGTAFVDLFFANGSTSQTYFLQGVEGVVDDSVQVSTSAPLFVPGTRTVRIYQPIYEIIGLAATRTSAEADDPFTIRLGTPTSPTATTFSSFDNVRAGGLTYTFSVVNDSVSVADLVTTAVTGDSVTVAITPGRSESQSSVGLGGVALRSTAAGVTTVRAANPLLRPIPNNVARTVTITQASITGTTGLSLVQPIGRGLMRSVAIQLSNTVIGNSVPITVRPSRPGLVLLSPNSTTLGVPDSVVATVGVGASSTIFSLQVLETPGPALDSLTLFFTAPGYTSSSAIVGIVDGVLQINTDLAASATTSSPDDPFSVVVGSPNSPTGTVISFGDNVRVGSAGLVVNVIVDSIGIGTLVTSGQIADSVQMTIPAGLRFTPSSVATGGVAFRYLAGGVTTVRANSALMRPLATAVRTVTVTAPSITTLQSFGLGSGLQRAASISLDSPAPTGGLPVTLRASKLGVLLLSPNSTTVGSDSLVVTVPAGASSVNVVIQALDVPQDTVAVTASSPGWTSRTSTYFVWPPVIQFNSVLTSVNSLALDDPFVVQIGSPASAAGTSISTSTPRRAGAPPYPVTIANSNGLVGKLVVNGVVADTQVVNILALSSQTPGTPATGAVQFRPLTTGTTILSATAVGATQSTGTVGTTVTVTTPGITMATPSTVGSGLQTSSNAFVTLGSTNHGGVNVIVRSSNPSVLRVARLVTDVASDSIVIPVSNGTATVSYVLAGIEGQTGSVQIAASASGFTDGTTTATVAPPTLDLVSVGTTITAGAADRAFQVRLGSLNTTGTGLSQIQVIRVGGAAITATVTSSDASALPLITSSTNGASATVTIVPGQSASPSTVVTGGVAIRPLAPGVSIVNATAPGFVVVNAATSTVTVNAP